MLRYSQVLHNVPPIVTLELYVHQLLANFREIFSTDRRLVL